MTEIGICKNIQQYDVQMTSNYVILLIKLSLNVGNDDYIILCNFDGLIISGLEAKERGASEPPPPLPGRRKQKTNSSEFFISLAYKCDLESHTAFHR